MQSLGFMWNKTGEMPDWEKRFEQRERTKKFIWSTAEIVNTDQREEREKIIINHEADEKILWLDSRLSWFLLNGFGLF